MDEKRFEGAARKVGGKVEGAVGDLTGDTKMQASGKISCTDVTNSSTSPS